MKRLDEGKKAAIRADHAAGMSIEQIRKKHNVAWPTVKNLVGGKSAVGKKVKTMIPVPDGGLFLRVKADEDLANDVWSRLTLAEKVTALNSLDK